MVEWSSRNDSEKVRDHFLLVLEHLDNIVGNTVMGSAKTIIYFCGRCQASQGTSSKGSLDPRK